mgnify:CR=1 FL=1
MAVSAKKLQKLLLATAGKQLFHVLQHAPEGFPGRATTLAGLAAHQPLGRGQQRPSPAIFAIVLVHRVDEVLGDDATGHLQTGDVSIEATAHLRTREAAGSTQLARNHTATLFQSQQDLTKIRHWLKKYAMGFTTQRPSNSQPHWKHKTPPPHIH